MHQLNSEFIDEFGHMKKLDLTPMINASYLSYQLNKLRGQTNMIIHI